SVAQTSSDQLNVVVIRVGGYVIDIPLLAAVGIERVADAELEAGEVRRDIRNDVVSADGCHRTERVADVGFGESVAERAGDAAQELRSDVGLATEVDRTPGIAGQTQSGLTAEQAIVVVITLQLNAVAQVEAAF